ncbi:nucleotide sugar dehydrogenase [Virgibacillus dokdonensis]|uniref:nucleotide sugar dehydrogenase n=1 Tax=Virgibacillus dokdonensis TaxID=302167 RepID=UPI00098B7A99|nr:nucleotide sugar dehydrogenase [Virgibacillus dokdonensis]
MTNQEETLANVTVVGLGKIGLTLAAVFANNHFNVYGSDINEDVVATINQGKSHITNEPGLDQLVAAAYNSKTLSATTETAEAVAKSNIVIVIVPVLIDNQYNVDYQFIDAAVKEIARGMKEGTLVIFETTIPPGDTQYRFGKKLEELSGLRLGEEFYLAYSPERVYSNRIIEDLKKYPKIVGGINEKSLELAVDFYKKALNCKLIEVSSLETAEFSKVAECVYRDVNIALANELAKFTEKIGVNMSEVRKASNSQPYSYLHEPGIGVGGHCIPIYPYFFINKGLTKGITPMARMINDSMADYAINKVEEEVGSLTDKNVLILGLAYRENVKEPTKSTTLLLIDRLIKLRANVFVNDPLFTNSEIKQYGVSPLSLQSEFTSKMDAVILQAFHKAYASLDFKKFISCRIILDGRNKLSKNEIQRLGITYRSIGNDDIKERL